MIKYLFYFVFFEDVFKKRSFYKLSHLYMVFSRPKKTGEEMETAKKPITKAFSFVYQNIPKKAHN
jgi:hypothetical protein